MLILGIEIGVIEVRETARTGVQARVREADLEIALGTGLDMAPGKLLGKGLDIAPELVRVAGLEVDRTDLERKPVVDPRPNLQDLLRARDQAVSERGLKEGPPSQGLLAVTGGDAIKGSTVTEASRVDPLQGIKAAGGAGAAHSVAEEAAVVAAGAAVEAAGARLMNTDKKNGWMLR